MSDKINIFKDKNINLWVSKNKKINIQQKNIQTRVEIFGFMFMAWMMHLR